MSELERSVLTFSDYQHIAKSFALYPEKHKLTYPTLGLNGEAGEVAEKVKKIIRDSGGVVSPAIKLSLQRELGDVLWYLSQVATDLDIDLGETANGNLAKLADRASRNAISGSGDDR